jgi:hypothetical protein
MIRETPELPKLGLRLLSPLSPPVRAEGWTGSGN